MQISLKAEEIGNNNVERWNNLLARSFYPSYRQAYFYARTQHLIQREVFSFIFSSNSKDIAGAHYSIKRSKFNLISTADIQSGFVLAEEPTYELLNSLVDHFTEFAKEKKVDYIRISPWFPRVIKEEISDTANIIANFFLNKGFEQISEGRHTYWIDLNKPIEQIFSGFNNQTKRNIKKAEKSELMVEVYREFNENLISFFWELYSNLGNRKGFSILSRERFFAEVGSLFKSGATLFIIKCKDQIVNMALATRFGIASYYHGALNLSYKELDNCPSPGHFIQWIIIKNLREEGISTYDMAYCPGPVPDANHPNLNMWRFKFGFGGKHVQFLPTYGKVINPIRGRILKHWLKQ